MLEEMLQKVKIKQGILPDNTESDAVIRLMLEDAMAAVKVYCRRSTFPPQLEYLAREIVNQTIDRDNADNVTSIKRGDMQISYQTMITGESYTAKQQQAMNRYRRLKIG